MKRETDNGQQAARRGGDLNGSSSRDTSMDERVDLPIKTIKDACVEYARNRPDVVTMWAFGVGFVVGWKLKPW